MTKTKRKKKKNRLQLSHNKLRRFSMKNSGRCCTTPLNFTQTTPKEIKSSWWSIWSSESNKLSTKNLKKYWNSDKIKAISSTTKTKESIKFAKNSKDLQRLSNPERIYWSQTTPSYKSNLKKFPLKDISPKNREKRWKEKDWKKKKDWENWLRTILPKEPSVKWWVVLLKKRKPQSWKFK